MLAEELIILHNEHALWQAARPLLEIALRLEQGAEDAIWHGWQKKQMNTFLATLPSPCSLVVGVWDTFPATSTQSAQDCLVLGIVCEVMSNRCRSSKRSTLTSTSISPERHHHKARK